MSGEKEVVGGADWTFFAAVRKLAAQQEGPGVGRSSRIEDDKLRFRQIATLSFAPNEVEKVSTEVTPNGDVVELTQTFFGPFGSKGVLPLHVTEDALNASSLLEPFLDIFTHRMTALLYRAWETTQIAVSRDRGAEDPYMYWLDSLYGQQGEANRERDALPDDFKRHMAGWLSNGRRSVAAVKSVLSAALGVEVEVHEFISEWLPVPEKQQTKLGLDFTTLGGDAMLGQLAYSLQSKLRVRTSPLSYDQYESLLPVGAKWPIARDVVRNLGDVGLVWDLQLALKRTEVPELQLIGNQRLGWNTWLVKKDCSQDRDDLTLSMSFLDK